MQSSRLCERTWRAVLRNLPGVSCEKLPQLIHWNPNIAKHLKELRDGYIKEKSLA